MFFFIIVFVINFDIYIVSCYIVELNIKFCIEYYLFIDLFLEVFFREVKLFLNCIKFGYFFLIILIRKCINVNLLFCSLVFFSLYVVSENSKIIF